MADAKLVGGQDRPARYVVAHSMVDGYHRGQTITIDHLRAGRDLEIDLDRLIALGAIIPEGDSRADAVLADLGPGAVTPEGAPVAAPVPVPAPPAKPAG